MPDSHAVQGSTTTGALSFPIVRINVHERLQLLLCKIKAARRTTNLNHDLSQNSLVVRPGAFALEVAGNRLGCGNVTETLPERIADSRGEYRQAAQLLVAPRKTGTGNQANQMLLSASDIVDIVENFWPSQLTQELFEVDRTCGHLRKDQSPKELNFTCMQLVVATFHGSSNIHRRLRCIGGRDAQPERHVAQNPSDRRGDASGNGSPCLPPDDTSINTKIHAGTNATPEAHVVLLPRVRSSGKLKTGTFQRRKIYWAELPISNPPLDQKRATSARHRDANEGGRH